MRTFCLNHSNSHRGLSTTKSNLIEKSDQMEESSN